MPFCLIVGAGMAGLTAARRLVDAGWRVEVVDKGRGPGGRMATRRLGTASFDHGAASFTASHPEFLEAVQGWRDAGLVAADRDGWRATGGMNRIPKHLAAGFDVCTATRVAGIARDGAGWRVAFEDGDARAADAVMVTAPVPQALALAPGCFDRTVEYDRCLVVLAVTEGDPGATVLRATPEFSLVNWDRPRDEVAAEMLRDAGVHAREWQIHGWKFATPIEPEAAEFWAHEGLLLAGDAFAAAPGRSPVERAWISGRAAAAALIG